MERDDSDIEDELEMKPTLRDFLDDGDSEIPKLERPPSQNNIGRNPFSARKTPTLEVESDGNESQGGIGFKLKKIFGGFFGSSDAKKNVVKTNSREIEQKKQDENKANQSSLELDDNAPKELPTNNSSKTTTALDLSESMKQAEEAMEQLEIASNVETDFAYFTMDSLWRELKSAHGGKTRHLSFTHVYAFRGQASPLESWLKLRSKRANMKDAAGCTPLHYASLKNHVDCVRVLLHNSADPNIGDSYEFSALTVAAASGNEKIVDILVQSKNINLDHPDKDGTRAIHWASLRGFTKICQTLIERGCKVNVPNIQGRTALHEAVLFGHRDIVALLIQNGADVNKKDKDGITPLHEACVDGTADMVTMLVKAGAELDAADFKSKSTPAHMASFYGNSICLQELKEAGANLMAVDFEGGTPLHNAVFNRQRACALLLIQTPEVDLNAKDINGYTPMRVAAVRGSFAEMRLLIEGGAEFDEPDKEGMTPLLVASFSGHGLCVLQLLEAGANVFHCDLRGRTALHMCAAGGDVTSAMNLLKYGAEIEQTDDFRMTPLLYATKFLKYDACDFLLYNGADVMHENAAGKAAIGINFDNINSLEDKTKRNAKALAAFGILQLLLDYMPNISLDDFSGVNPQKLLKMYTNNGVDKEKQQSQNNPLSRRAKKLSETGKSKSVHHFGDIDEVVRAAQQV